MPTWRSKGLSKWLISRGFSPLSWVLTDTDLEPTYAPTDRYLPSPLALQVPSQDVRSWAERSGF